MNQRKKLIDRIDIIVAWCAVAWGVVHCAITFASYASFTPDAVWFFSGGFHAVLAGFLNIQRIRWPSKFNSVLAFIGAFSFIAVCIGIVIAVPGAGWFPPLLIFVNLMGWLSGMSFRDFWRSGDTAPKGYVRAIAG